MTLIHYFGGIEPATAVLKVHNSSNSCRYFQITHSDIGVTGKRSEQRHPLDYTPIKTLTDGHLVFSLAEKYN